MTTPEGQGTAARLVAAVQAKGSDATDARDAAHEACHALEWGVMKTWTRDNIHARKPRKRSAGVASEITARAVEALVCADLGIPHDLEKWGFVCVMEMMKNERIALPSLAWLIDGVRTRMKTKAARELADRVLALGGRQ